jgi:hypothetical protein
MTEPRRADPTVVLLMVLTAMMTLTIFAVTYIVAFADPEMSEDAPDGPRPPSDAAPACDASNVETMACPPGHYCNIDRCEKLEDDPECGEGESCRECDCRSGLVCHHNECVDQKIVERVPPTCKNDKRLADAVKQLALMCSTRKTDVDTIVSTGHCSVADWEALALENERFDLLLKAFPNRFAVHFPSGKPSLSRRDWPRVADRDHVIGQIRAYREPLISAKQIFVIGRASPDGTPETNHLLALARMNLVSEMIHTVAFEGLAQTERDTMRVRIRSFTLPTTRPIKPEKYHDNYLADPGGEGSLGLEPLMTWDDRSLKDLKTSLADKYLLAERGSPEYQKLLNAINRVVLVIPIPCMGDEYEPPKTDLKDAAAGGAP